MQLEIPVINMKKTGQRIATLRAASGLSVKELQTALGFATPQAIYKWQSGMNMPTLDNIVCLASILHVRVEDILVLDYTSTYTLDAKIA